MTRLRWQISMRSTRAETWAQVVDFERMHTWFVGVRRMTLLAPEPFQGAERILRLVGGTTHRERITRWEPPERFSIVVLDPVFAGRDWAADIALHEDGPATELSWELRYEPRDGLAGSLLDRVLVQPVLHIVFRTSLRRLRDRTQRQEARRGHE
jgi:hypothetical protein